MVNDKYSEIIKVIKEEMFTVENMPLKFIRAKEGYNQDPRKFHFSDMSLAEILVHQRAKLRWKPREDRL